MPIDPLTGQEAIVKVVEIDIEEDSTTYYFSDADRAAQFVDVQKRTDNECVAIELVSLRGESFELCPRCGKTLFGAIGLDRALRKHLDTCADEGNTPLPSWGDNL